MTVGRELLYITEVADAAAHRSRYVTHVAHLTRGHGSQYRSVVCGEGDFVATISQSHAVLGVCTQVVQCVGLQAGDDSLEGLGFRTVTEVHTAHIYCGVGLLGPAEAVACNLGAAYVGNHTTHCGTVVTDACHLAFERYHRGLQILYFHLHRYVHATAIEREGQRTCIGGHGQARTRNDGIDLIRRCHLTRGLARYEPCVARCYGIFQRSGSGISQCYGQGGLISSKVKLRRSNLQLVPMNNHLHYDSLVAHLLVLGRYHKHLLVGAVLQAVTRYGDHDRGRSIRHLAVLGRAAQPGDVLLDVPLQRIDTLTCHVKRQRSLVGIEHQLLRRDRHRGRLYRHLHGNLNAATVKRESQRAVVSARSHALASDRDTEGLRCANLTRGLARHEPFIGRCYCVLQCTASRILQCQRQSRFIGTEVKLGGNNLQLVPMNNHLHYDSLVAHLLVLGRYHKHLLVGAVLQAVTRYGDHDRGRSIRHLAVLGRAAQPGDVLLDVPLQRIDTLTCHVKRQRSLVGIEHQLLRRDRHRGRLYRHLHGNLNAATVKRESQRAVVSARSHALASDRDTEGLGREYLTRGLARHQPFVTCRDGILQCTETRIHQCQRQSSLIGSEVKLRGFHLQDIAVHRHLDYDCLIGNLLVLGADDQYVLIYTILQILAVNCYHYGR